MLKIFVFTLLYIFLHGMKKLIPKIWVSILSLMVFVSTSGYYTFHHHCSYYNNVQNSIFLEVDCCHNFALGHIHEHSNHDLQFSKPTCCKTKSEYQKLNFPFEKIDFQKPLIPVKLFAAIDFENQLQNNIEEKLNNQYTYPIKGPPLIGKQFLFFTQQLKLSPPVC